jgi:hypothetical protein
MPSPARALELPKLRALRDEAAARCSPQSADSAEWQLMQRNLKVVVILLAGMDEGHERKRFEEFAPPERLQVKLQIRSMRRELCKLTSLAIH